MPGSWSKRMSAVWTVRSSMVSITLDARLIYVSVSRFSVVFVRVVVGVLVFGWVLLAFGLGGYPPI